MNLSRREILAALGAMMVPSVTLAESSAIAIAPAAPPLVFDAEAAITAAKLGAEVSFAVIDPASGQVIASRHENSAMAPASTLKIVTSLYALEKLGADHRFVTRVWRSGDTLILAGGGDPLLDTDGLAKLAAATAENWQGPAPTKFQVWGGALPQIDRLSATQDEHLPYNPSLSGMILNFNRVHLGWRQGKMSLEARGAKQSPRAYTVTIGAADRRAPLFTYDGSGKKEAWTISRGAIAKSGSRWLPVRHPELYAGDVFQTLCRAKGLILPSAEVATVAPSGTEITKLESESLTTIVRGMLKYSTNLTAEVIGIAASGASTPESSAKAMQEWLRGLLPNEQFVFHDHSGLSAENRLTAMSLARLVADQGRRRGLQEVLKHIPLRDEKGKSKQSPIEVLAKTGTLNFVSNLSGYAQTPDGRAVAFAILTGDEARRSASEGKEMPDGVSTWTRRSKVLQQALIEGWIEALPAQIAAPAGVTQPASVLR
ncbi:D-alanyl-D-alanine carboxypeptidase/D-alanyl-D-alanine endopeptidase [Paracoccus aestuariivivens]|uniref:D-alanyl-D-alanine carboxypeptidase/D-alanyl-D-alanine-endopeptidase n=1 Tax=Paracoccus aestuariivivens TaxID=1820333 RepID=A0A6L6JDS3_9RHOB|nr:D-alanyl-D-alanine carboxypeptidase/D-alanyl-D-alanine-endopeptidase [Paracoccus aestuariivivens]MTH79666.1 D-alanyl-D-alanine carboxypeptidase/D-alanyl-D-alanine-endopeptidase [Paracoccus aestuariivivens]